MKKILRVLRFVRLVDETDNLSLTNIAMIASFFAITTRPEVGTADAVGVLASVAGYGFKRWMQPEPGADTAEIDALKAAIASMETKITGVAMSQAIRKK